MDQHRFSLRAKIRSVFGVAFVIFVLLNIYCSFSNPFRFDPFKYSYRGWAWWTMNDLKRSAENVHNVAVLGSSLMVSAVAGTDATKGESPQDGFWREPKIGLAVTGLPVPTVPPAVGFVGGRNGAGV